jgi:hypothetical protein
MRSQSHRSAYIEVTNSDGHYRIVLSNESFDSFRSDFIRMTETSL